MTISSMVRSGVFGAAAGLGCLVVANGFDAAGQAGLQEAMFRSSVSYPRIVESLHCGATGPELARNSPGLPVE
jgi:hypothetical protein